MQQEHDKAPVLLTGATGYVGGRLAPRLLESGYRVRAMARSLEKLKCRPWAGHPLLETVKADAADLDSLKNAAKGCRAVFYLIHSMTHNQNYDVRDRLAAKNMTEAAASAGMERIIYLGGLGEESEGLSRHLKSRTEVARIMGAGPVPLTYLRAAMIIGSGSVSFEMLRYLSERLPVMIAPAWVNSKVQPIAIRNVLGYLAGCLENPATAGKTLDIGGPDTLTYKDLFRIFTEEAGLPGRIIIPVPWFTPKLSSYWIHLVTPVPASLARPLAEGLRNTVVVKNDEIQHLVPQELLSCRQAIRLALQKVRQQAVETCWMDAGELLPPEWPYCDDAGYGGGTIYEDGFRIRIKAQPPEVWDKISAIGGNAGWYYGQALWRIRGWGDRLVGGVGLRRGRRQSRSLQVGDALDFWRVLQVDQERRLLLLAEMKIPGEAVLEFNLEPLATGETELRQTARFFPRGLGGMLYWHLFLPFHGLLFPGMIKAIARAVGKPVTRGPERFRNPHAAVCYAPAFPDGSITETDRK